MTILKRISFMCDKRFRERKRYCSSCKSRKHSRRRPCSPMRKRRRDSPSHLEARRITRSVLTELIISQQHELNQSQATLKQLHSSDFSKHRHSFDMFSTNCVGKLCYKLSWNYFYTLAFKNVGSDRFSRVFKRSFHCSPKLCFWWCMINGNKTVILWNMSYI